MITTNTITVRLLCWLKINFPTLIFVHQIIILWKILFEQYIYRGYYSTIFAEGQTDEYCAIEDSNNTIIDIQIGGENTWAMVGHVISTVHLVRNSRKF